MLHPKKGTNTPDILRARRYQVLEPPLRLFRNQHISELPIGGCTVYTFRQKHKQEQGHIFYLHGGAYINGPTMPHWYFIRNLVKRLNVQVIVPDFPLAPENTFDHILETVFHCYEYFINERSLGTITIMGDSSGGSMALALSLILKENTIPQPDNIILISPWLDITLSDPEIAILEKCDIMLNKVELVESGKMYAGDSDRKHPYLSPLYADISGLAPIHIFTGTHELFLFDVRKFVKQAKEKDIAVHYHEYPGMFHCWILTPIPEAVKAFGEIKKILFQ